MITVIDMNCNEVGKEMTAIEYGEEIMCAGWNPAVNLVCEQIQEVIAAERIPMAVRLAALDSLDNDAMDESNMDPGDLYCSQR